MKKWLFVALFLLAAAYTFVFFNKQEKETIQQSEKTATLSIIKGEGQAQTYTIKIADGETAFSLLQKGAQENTFDIAFKTYDFGVFVESIDNLPNTKEKAWIYFVNQTSGNTAADKYLLKEADVVEWKYVKPTF